VNEPGRDNGPRKLYRDKEHALCCGVCAGIADYFGFDRTAVRVLAVVSQFLFPATIVVYAVMCCLVPRKPTGMYKDRKEEDFWRSVRKSPVATASTVRHKFRELDARLQKLERYVTSPGYGLDHEFRKLEEE
jgi:phage shock protein C